MDNIFFISAIISVIFTAMKFLEMRFLNSEDKKPIKFLVRDSLLVYFSVFAGNFIIEQIFPNVKLINFNNTQPHVFTAEPSF